MGYYASQNTLLHFILLLFSTVSLSNCDNTTQHSYTPYTACSSLLYSCGDLKNVGYPFWGHGRPKFCGVPGLQLFCENNNINNNQNYTTTSSLSRYNQLYWKGAVVYINNSFHTIAVNQTELFRSCHTKKSLNGVKNFRLKSSLKLANNDNDQSIIQLFYNCSANCVPIYHYNCKNIYGGNETAYYFGNNQLEVRKRLTKGCSCTNNYSIPVNNSVLHEINNHMSNVTNNNAWFFSVLTKWPLIMEYKANFTACYKCEHSGGKCGSLENSSSYKFVCHCQGATHPLTCPPLSDNKKRRGLISGLGLGIGVGVGVGVVAAVIVIWVCKKQKRGSSNLIIGSESLDYRALKLEFGGVPIFSYRELVEATCSFDHSYQLGNGGFGTVYYGKLKDGREVAVKRLFERSYRRIEQFMNEVHILTRLRHHNLVSLYGCTSQHSRELLLVYEFVKNGALADHLIINKTNSKQPLSLQWPTRLRIAIETATALSYLHASDIVHRDVKTKNILLDFNFSVKVADFGLSRLFPTDVTHVSTAPQGTPGYVDPEYNQCYHLTDKSDVYSFGVVLIELISSLPAVDMGRLRHEINLSNYAINRIQRCRFDDLVDPNLGFRSDYKVKRMTISMAELAFRCLQHDKELRPSMDEVLEALKSIEGADYDALLLVDEKQGVKSQRHNSSTNLVTMPSSSTENKHTLQLQNHQVHPISPLSVMENWISTSTSCTK